MPNAPMPLASARPSLVIEGQLASDLAASLQHMEVRERSDGMAQAQLGFGNWGLRDGAPGYTLFGRDRLEFGKKIEVKLGDSLLFVGRVMALQALFPAGGAGEAQLVVQLEDRLQNLRMQRRSRSFAQMSLADIARQIASDHGLQVSVNLSGPSHAVLAQVNQSDLAFLRERARSAEAELWVEGDNLHLASRAQRAAEPIALDYGGTLQSFEVRADLALQRTELSVSGWSVADKLALKETAQPSLLDAELDGGQGGATLLQQAFGARPDVVAHLNPANADEARSFAESWLKQIGRRFVVGHGVAQPNARLRPGASVKLAGLGPLFNGQYAVSAVCHRFDLAEGLRSEFTVERAAIGRGS